MKTLTNVQKVQEDLYEFPYHYIGQKIEIYKLIWQIEYFSIFNIIKNILKPFSNQKILDAGCGDGRFCYEFRDQNVDIIGVDYSQRAINFAKGFNPNVDFF